MIKVMLGTIIKIIEAIIRSAFWFSLWLFGLGLLTWFPMRWWPGDSLRPVQMLNYFMPWLLVGLLPASITALIARRKWLSVLLALPALLIMISIAPLFLPRPNLALANQAPLKIMSFKYLGAQSEP